MKKPTEQEIKKIYDDFNREVLEKLEAKHGKQWIKDNWEMLERDREIFEASNFL